MAEEIDLEKCNFRKFRSPVTLTLDRVTRHTVVHHSSTSIYIPNFIEIGKTFCGWTDVRTDVPNDGHFRPPLLLLGQLGRVDLIINQRLMLTKFTKKIKNCIIMTEIRHTHNCLSHQWDETRMWADTQRDGHSAKYMWHSLRKFRNSIPCIMPQNETRWNLLGCPKFRNRSQPLVGRKFAILCGHVEKILLFNKFFLIVDNCLNCEDTANKVVR